MTQNDDLPVGDEKVTTVRAMFDRVAHRYDLVNRVMTFGMDVGWRRRTVRELRLPGGARVADLACGTGDLCNELERNGYRPVGFDFSRGMLVNATSSVPLVQADILRLPVADGTIDGATCGFALRNVTDVGELFTEVARILRRGGSPRGGRRARATSEGSVRAPLRSRSCAPPRSLTRPGQISRRRIHPPDSSRGDRMTDRASKPARREPDRSRPRSGDDLGHSAGERDASRVGEPHRAHRRDQVVWPR